MLRRCFSFNDEHRFSNGLILLTHAPVRLKTPALKPFELGANA
jgi:hypothetical protein